MKTAIFTIAFSLLLFVEKNIACDCLPVANFCKTITYENNGEIFNYLNIYYVKVISQSADTMEVSIAKTFFGQNLTGSTILIQGGNGADCQVMTAQFQVGEELIIAAAKTTTYWYVSDCGISFLKVENGVVKGLIADGITEIPLADFPTLADCGNLQLNPANEPEAPYFIDISPTLTHDFVKIKISVNSPSPLFVRAFDVAGKMVFEKNYHSLHTTYEEVVPTENWAKGVYFFNIEVAGKHHTFKTAKAY